MKKTSSTWIPYADVMAALVLVFILVIIFFVIQSVDRYTEPLELSSPQPEIIEIQEDILTEATENQEDTLAENIENQEDILIPVSTLIVDLYNELNSTVAGKYDDWGAKLLDDLTITFEKPVVLFEQDRYEIKPEFIDILDDWSHLYLSIVTKDKYRNLIKEIKVEGHTARISPIHNSYIRTVELSQHRARAILEYLLSSDYFLNLSPQEQQRLEYIISAGGMGYGRAIDDNYVPVIESGNPISHKSRRVLFKLVTGQREEDVVAYVRNLLEE